MHVHTQLCLDAAAAAVSGCFSISPSQTQRDVILLCARCGPVLRLAVPLLVAFVSRRVVLLGAVVLLRWVILRIRLAVVVLLRIRISCVVLISVGLAVVVLLRLRLGLVVRIAVGVARVLRIRLAVVGLLRVRLGRVVLLRIGPARVRLAGVVLLLLI